jgi:rhodanese-related sulfurtransferase
MLRTIDERLIADKLHRGEHLAFLDISEGDAYERVHLPHALHIAVPDAGMAPERMGRLATRYLPNRGAQVVLVDSRGDRERLLAAADALQALGYPDLWILQEGTAEWRDHGQPTATNVNPNPAAERPDSASLYNGF